VEVGDRSYEASAKDARGDPWSKDKRLPDENLEA
jgi:hypothetical protein